MLWIYVVDDSEEWIEILSSEQELLKRYPNAKFQEHVQEWCLPIWQKNYGKYWSAEEYTNQEIIGEDINKEDLKEEE